MLTQRLLAALAAMLVAMSSLAVRAQQQADKIRIVTGSERGTYIQIGKDLSRWVAQPAGITLDVLPSQGSSDNVSRLRSERAVALALVQSDVYQAFLDKAASGDTQAERLIKPLRVVLPLYEEEIYFVVRADSPMNFIHEIKDKRINVGPIGSGTALSATTIYRAMFGASIPEQSATYLSNEAALLKLATDRSIDVAVVVAGQPAKLFSEMKPEARNYIKLLQLDPNAPQVQAALQTYFPAKIRATSYPSWLNEDVQTLSTKAFLVTYDYQQGATMNALKRFSRSLCNSVATLKAEGHPKWQDVNFELPSLGQGWQYYGVTQAALSGCANAALAARGRPWAGSSAVACTQDRLVLGMCRR